MSKLIILVFSTMLLLASGSAAAEWEDWSDKSKEQYKTFLILQSIDTTQTWSAINCQKHTYCTIEELNPILGSHPSKGELLALKLAGNYFLYKVLDKKLNNDGREKHLRVLNGVFTVVVMSNGIQLTKQF